MMSHVTVAKLLLVPLLILSGCDTPSGGSGGGAATPPTPAPAPAPEPGVVTGDVTPPKPGTLEDFAEVTAKTAAARWQPATDDISAADKLQYLVCSGAAAAAVESVAACEAATIEMPLAAATTTFKLTNKAPGQAIFVNVLVLDEAGNKAVYAGKSLVFLADEDSAPPSPGAFAAVTSLSSTGMTLHWSAAEDAVSKPENISYQVCSSSDPSAVDTTEKCTVMALGTVEGKNPLQFLVTNLAPLTTYYFNVVAKDEAGNGAIYLGLTQQTQPDLAPPVVGTFSATSEIRNTALTIRWTSATDDATESDALEYLLCTGNSAADLDTPAKCEAATVLSNYAAKHLTEIINGLSPATIYYYNVVVRDAAGNKAVYPGLAATTTADSVPPTPGAFSAATGVGDTGFTLHWTAASDAISATSALSYLLCIADDAAKVDTVAECEATGVAMNYTTAILSKTLTGKTPQTTYYANVVVMDLAGNSAIYGGVSVQTAADTTSPTAGAFVASTGVGNIGFTLNWSAASDNASASSAIEYLLCSGASAAAIDTVAECEGATTEMAYVANAALKSLTGKLPSTTYYYNLVVRDQAGNKTAYSPKSQATTADVTAPTSGGFAATTSVGNTGFTLNWNAASDNAAAASTLIYKVCTGASAAAIDTVDECDAATQVMAYTANTLTLVVTGKNPATTYYFNVIAKDPAGNRAIYSGKTQATSPDVTAPVAGAFAASTSIGVTGYVLNWTAASDNAAAAANLSYLLCSGASAAAIDSVSKCENATVDMAYTVATLTKTISSKSPGQAYYYNVVVKDPSGNRSLYEGKTQATAGDTSAPTVGTFSASTSVGFAGFTLNWTAASDDGTPAGQLQYLVCSGPSTAAIDTIAECEAETIESSFQVSYTSYNKQFLPPGTTYYYNVVVRDADGNKAIYAGKTQATNTDSTAPVAGSFSASTSVTATGFTLKWTASTDNATNASQLSYKVCKGASVAAIDTVAECEAATEVMPYTTATLQTTLSSLTPSTTYFYNVVVKDETGNKSAYAGKTQATIADSVAPNPGAFQATSGVTDVGFTLNWAAASDNATAAASLQYRVCSGASAAAIDTIAECEAATSELAYTANVGTLAISGRTPLTTYYYNTVVKDEAGNKAIYAGTSQATTADTTNPTAGALTSPGLSTRSLTINWSAGSDNASQASALQYYVCSGASSAAIDTVGECSGATQRMDWATATLTKNVTGLSPGTAYYFNVLVKDAAGNTSAFVPQTVRTTPAATLTADAPRDGVYRQAFFDSVNSRHWVIYQDGSTVRSQYSSDGVTWTAGATIAAATRSLATHFKSVAGSAYVFLATQEGDYDIKVRRGALTATTLTWDAAVTVFDGASAKDMYRNGAVGSDDTNLWVAASYFDGAGWTTRVRESTNAANGNLSAWQAATPLGSRSPNPREIALLPGGGEDLIAVYENDGSVVSFKETSGSWSELTASGESAFTALARTPGINGKVFAVAVLGSELYVGGSFTNAGGDPAADYLAKWDGSKWRAVAPARNAGSGDVSALTIYKGDVYAGFYDSTGGYNYYYVSKWNGSSWQDYGTYLLSQVEKIVVNDATVYAFGYFTDVAGNANVDYAVKSTGGAWSGLGSTPLNGGIYDAQMVGNDLVVGGAFTNAGGVADADYLAKWNGTAWQAVAAGLNGPVQSVVADGSDLYVGGYFTDAGGDPNADYIAKWNGSSWVAFGTGPGEAVNSIAMVDSILYVGGVDDVILKKWTGAAWSSLVTDSGFMCSFGCSAKVAGYGGDIIIAGAFVSAVGTFGGDETGYVSKWTGTEVVPMTNSPFNGTILALAMDGSDLYVGGAFTDVGGDTNADGIVKWNGTTWQSLGTGLNGQVNTILVSSGKVYAGGTFLNGGGDNNADRIAFWDGSSWQAMGTGTSGVVYAIAAISSDIYAGGSFFTAGGVTANYLAKWNGTTWSALGSGTAVNGAVLALATIGTNLYAGGNFSDAAGLANADGVAKWDGSAWSALGTGTTTVNAMVASGSNLYVGSSFTNFGGNANADYIAKWDGSSWQALGNGLTNGVFSVAVSGSNVYAGKSTGNGTTSWWDGSNWQTLAPTSHAIGAGTAMLAAGSEVYLAHGKNLTRLSAAVAGDVRKFSATAADAGEIVLVYSQGVTGAVKTRYLASGTWSSATTLASSGGSNPSVSGIGGDDLEVAFWLAGGALKYKRRVAGTWDSSPTTFIGSGESLAAPSCDFIAALTAVECLVTSGSSSPFDLGFWRLNL